MHVSSAELVDAFGRIREVVHEVVGGLTPGQLAFRLDSQANSIAWLVWHLTRVQDDHVADVAQAEQTWTADGWAERFALPFDVSATGYGHGTDDVAAVQVGSGALLTGYHDAVHDRTVDYVAGLTDSDFARIIDESWDPPVSLGVRLVSVISDGLQHAGQAAFIRGVAERRAASL
ncbi:MAG: mycothiol transferase [Carbonactinosporaceae bacterium]